MPRISVDLYATLPLINAYCHQGMMPILYKQCYVVLPYTLDTVLYMIYQRLGPVTAYLFIS